MPVKIVFEENHIEVELAVKKANELLSMDDFYNRIKQKESFDLSTATPQQVSDIINSSSLLFAVEFFYPNFLNFKYRKTFAYTDGRFPNRLFLNYKKLNRSIESIAATIIHEAIHAVDDAEQVYTFGHGNNSPVGKQNTAPYWIGNLALTMLLNSDSPTTIMFDVEEE